ncbi:MAG TPA: formate dehydrogenase accessory sulfurtransferase FdhD [Pseudomonas xinjiangensis]|uniref:Sulfur carrier protein FdhD n=2 Tax=root TaxID=1 RepID=A0A7V1BSP1_9GAMM|nr:formate dehydrogenase accessory sulfurtransferase FdhD [Halopseudomonas xinjiangensis]HEC47882.1 formate dehydrogenase accessory sulfurtransferase FdhD [Halopseudomonas xinjiangensis]
MSEHRVPMSGLNNFPEGAHEFTELAGEARVGAAVLAEESALALSYNGISQAVMMVSPNFLEDFAVGFSLCSGLVASMDDIYAVELRGSGAELYADIEISSRAFWALKQHRRNLTGNSGCGLCGVEALEQALPNLPHLQPSRLPGPEQLQDLRQRIDEAQEMARQSGALHAALFMDSAGETLVCREDIGRHNALDKLIGAMHRQSISREGFAVVTSRCSLELIHKAIRGGIATLVSLSAPTALSVQWARQHGLNLLHVPHRSAPRLYSPAP